jgi:hypothetical protein
MRCRAKRFGPRSRPESYRNIPHQARSQAIHSAKEVAMSDTRSHRLRQTGATRYTETGIATSIREDIHMPHRLPQAYCCDCARQECAHGYIPRSHPRGVRRVSSYVSWRSSKQEGSDSKLPHCSSQRIEPKHCRARRFENYFLPAPEREAGDALFRAEDGQLDF